MSNDPVASTSAWPTGVADVAIISSAARQTCSPHDHRTAKRPPSPAPMRSTNTPPTPLLLPLIAGIMIADDARITTAP
jgi:hypothetical protein